MRIARESFAAEYNGERVHVEAGVTRVAEDHELVGRFPDRFGAAEPVGVTDSRGCEFRAVGPDGLSEPLFTPEMLDRALEERERRERLREAARTEGAQEAGVDLSSGGGRTARRVDRSPGHENRDRALRAIDERGSELSAESGDRLVALVERDQQGLDSRYIAAVSDPAYERAFLGLLMRPEFARHESTSAESAALHEVLMAGNARAMSIGDPAGPQDRKVEGAPAPPHGTGQGASFTPGVGGPIRDSARASQHPAAALREREAVPRGRGVELLTHSRPPVRQRRTRAYATILGGS